MKPSSFLFAALISWTLAFPLNPAAPAATQTDHIVLIVPARPRLIELSFDLAKMRDLTVVSFRGQAGSSDALVHVWNGRKWEYVPFDDFCAMRFLGRPPQMAIIIGDDQVVPKGILKGLAWPCKTERLQTLNIADLLNGLNNHLNFSAREWKRMAKRYDLKLENLNAERQAYNPYDVPRSKLPLPAEFKQERDDLPPAVIEKPNTSQPPEKPWIK